jgi:hypothetical protein
LLASFLVMAHNVASFRARGLMVPIRLNNSA